MNFFSFFKKNKFKLNEEINSGTYGKVFKVKYKKKFVAVKKININVYRDIEYLISKENNNNNLLCYCMEKKITKSHILLIFDYYKKGDLFEFLDKKKYFCESKVKNYILQMLLAIFELNNRGYVHMDIKLENFLIKNDNRIILTDFGSAKEINNDDKKLSLINGFVGTLHYISPEIILGYYSNKSDLWSIGVCMYLLLTGHFLYNNIEEHLASKKKIEIYNISLNCINLLNDLLRKSPVDRIDINTALNNTWFN